MPGVSFCAFNIPPDTLIIKSLKAPKLSVPCNTSLGIAAASAAVEIALLDTTIAGL